MERIINDEFIAYKTGFIDGKNYVFEQAYLSDSNFFIKEDLEDGWYSFGYNDAFNFYLAYFSKTKGIQEEVLTRKATNEILNTLYANRVAQENSKKETPIPLGKFRI